MDYFELVRHLAAEITYFNEERDEYDSEDAEGITVYFTDTDDFERVEDRLDDYYDYDLYGEACKYRDEDTDEWSFTKETFIEFLKSNGRKICEAITTEFLYEDRLSEDDIAYHVRVAFIYANDMDYPFDDYDEIAIEVFDELEYVE